MSKEREIKKPSFGFSLAVCVVFLLLLSVGMLVLALDTISLMIAGLLFVCICTATLGYNFDQMLAMIIKSVSTSMPSLLILISVGAVVGAWMTSGTIPALIYYGLEFLSPSIFLPFGLILCSIMSVSCGTSWGTVATLGVVFMGIGETMGIPSPVVAGMVICGACFGDKMSPISDTTNLAAMGTEIDVYRHIKSMTYTTGPTYIICFITFCVLGTQYADTALDTAGIVTVQQELAGMFNMNIIVLLPIIITLTMSFMKFPALVAIISGVVAGCFIACTMQGVDLATIMNNLNYGFSAPDASAQIYSMLNRGGIQSMMWTMSMSIIIIGVSGVLDEAGYLPIIVERISKHIKNAGNLVMAAIFTDYFCCMATGDSYAPIIITGKLYSNAFDEQGVDRSVLSRCCEEGATLAVPLIPWSVTAAYFSGTLGVAVLDYAPYAILNWLNPIISIVFAYLGIAIFKKKMNEKKVKKEA